MSDQVPYHLGVVVPDVPAAMQEFSATLGYVFNEPIRLPLHHFEDRIAGTAGPTELYVTYSRTGRLRIELIESHGAGVFSPDLAKGVHHVGVWESDPEGRLQELEAAGQSID